MNVYLMRGLVVVWGLLGGIAQAQHVHTVPHTTTHVDTVRHGNHLHSVPHTTTHLDNRVHYGPDYIPHTTTHDDRTYHNGHVDLTPHTTTHLLRTYPTYPRGMNDSFSPGYSVSPGYTVVSPAVSNSVNVTSLKPNSLPYNGRGVKIILPADVGGVVSYLIDGVQESEIKSGQEQLLARKGSYEVRFSRGEDEAGRDFGIARYTVTEGTYRFVVNENGWDLQRDRDSGTKMVAPQVTPPLKKNSLPSRLLPSIAIPSTPEPSIIP